MIHHQGTKDTKTHQGEERQKSEGVSIIAKVIGLLILAFLRALVVRLLSSSARQSDSTRTNSAESRFLAVARRPIFPKGPQMSKLEGCPPTRFQYDLSPAAPWRCWRFSLATL